MRPASKRRVLTAEAQRTQRRVGQDNRMDWITGQKTQK